MEKRSEKSILRRRKYDLERAKLPNRKAYLDSLKEKNKLKTNERMRNKMKEYRILALNHYSEGNGCNCCGENKFEFLAIDHINNDGSSHRKEYKKKYRSIADFVVRNNFPKGFQVLCHNCNLSKGFYGYCPHSTVFKD